MTNIIVAFRSFVNRAQKNCTFCPNNDYVFFIQSSTNSDFALYNMTWPVFTVEMKIVYWTVRTGSLNKTIYAKFFSNYQLNAQFLYSSTICMLHHDPQHVSSSKLLILRRTNCIATASGIVTLCKQPYSMPVYRTALYRGWRYQRL